MLMPNGAFSREEELSMRLCGESQCTGCSACANVCPIQCITMCEGSGGFLFPVIDADRCVNCRKCESVCPSLSSIERHESRKAFLSALLDNEVGERSSSGGIAYALGKKFLAGEGVVFGAAYGDGLRVSHRCVESEDGLSELQGSKYVQSAIGKSYEQTIRFLSQKRKVLFFGTPCQIAGLISTVPEELHELLYTCEILCKGVPSPTLFAKYVAFLKSKHKCAIVDLNFRSKKYGYSYGYLSEIYFANGESKVLSKKDASFVRTVGAGYVRPSCSSCRYKDRKRTADVSIGDFAKYASKYECGVSSVLVNTEKGAELLKSISDSTLLEPVSVEEIVSSQNGAFVVNNSRPDDYDQFQRDAEKNDWNVVYKQYLKPVSLKAKLTETVPPSVWAQIRKLKKISR